MKFAWDFKIHVNKCCYCFLEWEHEESRGVCLLQKVWGGWAEVSRYGQKVTVIKCTSNTIMLHVDGLAFCVIA